MTETNNKTAYPFLLLAMICCFLIFLAWSAFKAAGLGSKVTDADYYTKGLKYNTTMVEKRAAEVLGWKLSTRLEGRLLEFHVVDSSGSVVDKAAGTLYLAGEVRWCRPIPGTNRQPEWSAGLNLLNADDSDIDSWGVLLDAMES